MCARISNSDAIPFIGILMCSRIHIGSTIRSNRFVRPRRTRIITGRTMTNNNNIVRIIHNINAIINRSRNLLRTNGRNSSRSRGRGRCRRRSRRRDNNSNRTNALLLMMHSEYDYDHAYQYTHDYAREYEHNYDHYYDCDIDYEPGHKNPYDYDEHVSC